MQPESMRAGTIDLRLSRLLTRRRRMPLGFLAAHYRRIERFQLHIQALGAGQAGATSQKHHHCAVSLLATPACQV